MKQDTEQLFISDFSQSITPLVRGWSQLIRYRDNMLYCFLGENFFSSFYDRWLTQNYAWLEDGDYAPFQLMHTLSHRYQASKNQERRAIILGAPGSGRTTFLQKEYASYITNYDDNRAVPLAIYFSANALITLQEAHPDTNIYNILVLQIEKQMSHSLPSSSSMDDPRQKGTSLICLDDVDHLSPTQWPLFENVLKQLSTHPDRQILLTSTFTGYEKMKHIFQYIPQIEVVELLPWSDKDIRSYLDHSSVREPGKSGALWQHIEQHRWLHHLLTHPGWLNGFCWLVEETGVLPQQPSVFFHLLFHSSWPPLEKSFFPASSAELPAGA